jgi:hypothetical protein
MPSYVLKADPSRDLYVLWSTGIDNIAYCGDRIQMLTMLTTTFSGGESSVARLERADQTGTSTMWCFGSELPFGAWEGDRLIVDQRGMLRRTDLAAYAEAWQVGDDAAMAALLQPFEDEG